MISVRPPSKSPTAEELDIRLTADADAVGMGRSVILDVEVLDQGGRPVTECLLLPHVDGRRWGAHEMTDAQGRRRVVLPLPNPGVATVTVQVIPRVFDTSWIWSPDAAASPVYFLRRFRVDEPVHEADLVVAVAERCELFLNGRELGGALSFAEVSHFDLRPHLRQGYNLLAAVATNQGDTAGFVAQLRLRTASGERFATTGPDWECWSSTPSGWPGDPSEAGHSPRVVSRLVDVAVEAWATDEIQSWPGTVPRECLITGHPLPDGALVSGPVQVRVHRRHIESRSNPDQLIGMQWGSYFFPEMFFWTTAHAVPLVGFYQSYDPDVIRQHAIWMMDMGIDFIFSDWPQPVEPDEEGRQPWGNRPLRANGQIHATQVTLEVYAQLRDEGYPVPRLVIMPFLCNGPVNSTETVNEQLQWLYDYFIRNPRFRDLWVRHDGKPLIAILYSVPTHHSELPGPPVDDTHFTVRYMGAQNRITGMAEHGYWSWMDGIDEPLVTFNNGDAEVVTSSPAYFDRSGWLGATAAGRRNGTTYVRSFFPAIAQRPRYVLLHQWSEYAGQIEGFPYPDTNFYGDSYSVELSDELEPVSLTAEGYRGGRGGWGFFYSNLSQAIIEVLRQDPLEDTVIALYPPDYGSKVAGTELAVGWEVIGREPDSCTLLLDERIVAEGLAGRGHTLDITQLSPGGHLLSLIAHGTTTRYHLGREREDVRLDMPIPLRIDTPFTLQIDTPFTLQEE